MLDVGKKRRLKRIMPDGKTLIVPMDHGISSPVRGIQKIDRVLEKIDGLCDAVVLHKGVVKNSRYVENMDSAIPSANSLEMRERFQSCATATEFLSSQ